jgi:hypothetical protein
MYALSASSSEIGIGTPNVEIQRLPKAVRWNDRLDGGMGADKASQESLPMSCRWFCGVGRVVEMVTPSECPQDNQRQGRGTDRGNVEPQWSEPKDETVSDCP